MPGRVFEFTARQTAAIREIEELCHAEVIVLAPIPDTWRNEYEGFLSRPQDDPSGGWREENGELCYLRDDPTAEMMSEEELRRYPEHIRRMFPTEKHDLGSCNMLPSFCGGPDVDNILRRLRSFTVLLQMGWHLGREEDFDDPYSPAPEPMSVEELMWQDYQDYREEKSREEDLTEIDRGDIF